MMHTACDCALHGSGKAEVAAWLCRGCNESFRKFHSGHCDALDRHQQHNEICCSALSTASPTSCRHCDMKVASTAPHFWIVQKILHELTVETSLAVARCRECDAALRILPLTQLKPEAGGQVLLRSIQSCWRTGIAHVFPRVHSGTLVILTTAYLGLCVGLCDSWIAPASIVDNKHIGSLSMISPSVCGTLKT